MLSLTACPLGPALGPFLYVADFSTNSVTAYSTNASANAPPFKTYQGASTQLAGPVNVAVDTQHTLYVINDGSAAAGPSVTVYPIVNGGNVAPTLIIQGPLTALSSPRAVAIDNASNVWVANFNSNSVTAYTPTGASNREPFRTITTGVSHPIGVGFYYGPGPYNGALYILNSGPPSVSIYFNAGASGSPTQTLAGSNTHLSNPQGFAVDIGGNLWISEYDADAVLFFAGGNEASGNVSPWVVLTGPSTGLSGPKGVAIDGAGVLYVANGRNTSITTFKVSDFTFKGSSSGPSINVAPATAITGSATQLAHIIGLGAG
jgi:hypothetical protein